MVVVVVVTVSWMGTVHPAHGGAIVEQEIPGMEPEHLIRRGGSTRITPQVLGLHIPKRWRLWRWWRWWRFGFVEVVEVWVCGGGGGLGLWRWMRFGFCGGGGGLGL
jgi:hypothetical protein